MSAGLGHTISAKEIAAVWPPLGAADALSIARAGVGWRISGSAGSFHLRQRSSREALNRELAVIAHLHSEGIAAPLPTPTASGASIAEVNGKCAFLYRELPGSPTSYFDGRAGLERADRLGSTLARLHLSLSRFTDATGFARFGASPDLIEKIIAAGDAADARAFNAIGQRRRSFEGLSWQLIHRDFHPGNVLFQNDRLSGIIDLDHLLIGPRLFDLCYCLLYGPLVAMAGRAEKSRYWLEIAAAFTAGYERLAALSPIERYAFADMMIEIELIFMHWFRLTGQATLVPSIETLIYWLDGARDELARAAGA